MQFSLVLYALIATLAGRSFNAHAGAVPPRSACERYLLEAQAELDPLIGEDFLTDEKLPTQPSVRVIHALPGRTGGYRMVIERIGARWISSHRAHRFDPQGDPRWLIDVLGARAAAFFGFEMINDYTMTVPDAFEFQGAVERLNQSLPEPIAITFHLAPDNENVSVSSYIRNFARSAAIPLANSGNHLIHDLSFHSGAVVLPARVVDLKQLSAIYLDEFIAYLSAKYPEGPAQAAVRYYAYLWRFREVQTIDVGTALISPGIISALRSPNADRDYFIRSTLRAMTNNGFPLPTYLRHLVNDLTFNSRRALENYAGFGHAEKVAVHLRTLGILQLRRDLTEFQAAYDPSGARTIAPYLAVRGSRNLDRLCRETQARRLAISRAAAALP